MESDVPLTVGLFSYNHSRYVVGAIESLAKNLDSSFKLICIDDGSTDGTINQIKYALEENVLLAARTCVIADNQNFGFGVRLNQFLELVTSPYWCVMSADDEFVPGALKTLNDISMSFPVADVVFGKHIAIDEDGVVHTGRNSDTDRLVLAEKYTGSAKSAYLDLITRGNFISGGCSIVRAGSSISRGIRFDEHLRNAEDWDYWLRLGRTTNFLYVDAHLWNYRIAPGSKYQSAGPTRTLCELEIIGSQMIFLSKMERLRASKLAMDKWKALRFRHGGDRSISFRKAGSLLGTGYLTLVPVLLYSLATAAARKALQKFRRPVY